MAAADAGKSQKPQATKAWSRKSFADMFSSKTVEQAALMIKSVNQYKGEPVVFFDQTEIFSLAAPFMLALVGKFSHGRPSTEALRKEFHTVGLVEWIPAMS